CAVTCGDGVQAGSEACDDGNTTPGDGCSATCTVELPDSTPPAAPVITGPTQGAVLSNPSPPLTGTAEPGSTVTVREGNTVLCTAVASDTGTWSCVPTTPLADGPHTVVATATDASGNTGPASNQVTFTIDTQAPDTSIPRGPETRSDEDNASFEYASTETGVTYQCSLDGREFGPCQNAYDVGAGEHTLHVRSVDSAGNVDPSPAVYTWTVEFTRAFAGGGCSTAPASSGLALLGLLGLRRRSRKARAQQ
ncbi:Ig-like domain-containing protein, partial [Pyxidicoccus sp. 3LFB2]